MPRYLIQLSYSGKNYHGWQVQENTPHTVQQVLSEGISTFIREKILVTGCGRTDTGVHASQYYGHFDVELAQIDLEQFVYKANKILPNDIAVQAIWEIKASANSRLDAIARTYRYYIHQSKHPFLTDTSYYLFGQLNMEAMNAAAALLLRHNDFECFSKVHTEVENFLCTVTHAKWEINEREQIVFTITANRFLRNMVRAIVGTLLQVGKNEMIIQDFEQVILSKDRKQAGHSAPAHGLFLETIRYPSSFFDA
jgi:tRNA pseudouridine38-40 synthase